MLHVEPSNVAFLKTYNTDFDEIIITFTDQNCRPLEIEEKVNLTVFMLTDIVYEDFFWKIKNDYGTLF